MEKTRIGIIGAGEITRKVHLPILQSMTDVSVEWLFDRRSERARLLGAACNVPAVQAAAAAELPDCDVVLLAIPVEARAEYLQEFAVRETAVFCEKPFALNAAEHCRIVATFPVHKLACGYMRRCYGSVMLMQDILQRGWLGELKGLVIREGNRSRGSGSDGSFLDDAAASASRGVLTDLGSHSIDTALHLSRAESFEVRACGLCMDGPVDRKVEATIVLRGGQADTSTGIELDYCVSWLDRQPNIIELKFEHCSLWSGLAPGSRTFLGNPAKPQECVALDAPGQAAITFNQAFFRQWSAFLTGMRTATESIVSARSALLTTTLVERLLQASVHG